MLLAALLAWPFRPARALPSTDLAAWAEAQGALCTAAALDAERRHGIPPGLLLAIAKVESGRPLPPAGALAPWPWTTDADGAGAFYDTKQRAVAGAAALLARGASLDVGCFQVNLRHHPHAFATLEEAFDPGANADYAARFLLGLQQGPAGGNWMVAAGFYHSQNPVPAAAYRGRVGAVLAGLPLPRGGPPPLFRRAVQRGVLRLDLGGGAVRVSWIGGRGAVRAGRATGRPGCTVLPGGASHCTLR